MLWMPPEPGWLGRFIDERSEKQAAQRQIVARRRLRDIGMSEWDIDEALRRPKVFARWVQKMKAAKVGWPKLRGRR